MDKSTDEVFISLTVAVQNYQIGTLFRVVDIYCHELGRAPPIPEYENLFSLFGPYISPGVASNDARPCAMEIDSFLMPLPAIIRPAMPPIIRNPIQ